MLGPALAIGGTRFFSAAKQQAFAASRIFEPRAAGIGEIFLGRIDNAQQDAFRLHG